VTRHEGDSPALRLLHLRIDGSVPDDLAAQAIVFISNALEALGSKRKKRSVRE
jgi:hypothetical protein